MDPSLFTWPMTNTVISRPLASCIRAMVQSFTWPILPGGLSSAPLYMVWMESTMRISGSSSDTDWSISSRAVSESTSRFSLATPNRWERSFS